MKLLICGDRSWTDRWMIRRKLASFKSFNGNNHTIVHGGGRGADRLAGEEAADLGFEVVSVPADWKRHGKAAGPIRNREMLAMKPDLVWAFHDNLSASKGTRNMVKVAREAGVKVVHFIHDLENA